MKNWIATVIAVGALALPGQIAFADQHEGEEDQKIYLDEEYDEGRDWSIGIGIGLVDLGSDFFVDGENVVIVDNVDQYLTVNLRIPFGGRNAKSGSGSAGFGGYLEPELAYWDDDFSSDLLVGINIVGAMQFNAVEFFTGGGIGLHFLDSNVAVPGGDDSDEALGINAHFGVDVSVSESVSLFGMGRFDLVDDDRNEIETKAAVGLRFRF